MVGFPRFDRHIAGDIHPQIPEIEKDHRVVVLVDAAQVETSFVTRRLDSSQGNVFILLCHFSIGSLTLNCKIFENDPYIQLFD
jgi:hypothetical protein